MSDATQMAQARSHEPTTERHPRTELLRRRGSLVIALIAELLVILLVMGGCKMTQRDEAASVSGETSSTIIASVDLDPARLEVVGCEDESFASHEGIDFPGLKCGVLSAPERRDVPAPGRVRLPFVIVPATQPGGSTAVYLSGGPGDSAVSQLELFTRLPTRSDAIVLLDQRGTGGAEPSLNCPEVEQAIWANFNSTDSASIEDDRLLDTYTESSSPTRPAHPGSPY